MAAKPKRPPREKTKNLNIRTTPAQLASWGKAAAADSRTLSNWVCVVLDRAAKSTKVRS